VDTGDGNDAVFYTLRDNLVQNLNLTVKLGSGDDRVDLRTAAGATISGPRVAIDVEGGSGRDWVSGSLGTIQDSTLTVISRLGSGESVFNYYLKGDILGHAQARFLSEGGTGNATVGLHASDVAVAQGALLEADLRGATGHNLVAFDYGGQIDGRLYLRGYGGPGVDRMALDVTADAGSTGAIDALFRGDAGKDVTSFRLHDHTQKPNGHTGLSLLKAVVDHGLKETTLVTGDVQITR
jgi:hypothetical protein